MITRKQMQTAVDLVARVQEKHLGGSRSPFHLSPCGGCGLPCFQQPCLVCGFYPHYSDESRRPGPQLSCDAFVKSVETSAPNRKGNIGTWLASNYRRTLAPYLADNMMPEMLALELPSASSICEFFKESPEAETESHGHKSRTVHCTNPNNLPF